MTPPTATSTRACHVIRPGCIAFQEAWDWQRRLVAERSAGRCDDTLLLLEHPPTITLGNKAKHAHILVAPEELARRGVALVETDRGGDVTYHAPGQIVGYPILKLSRYGGDLGRYVRNIEELVIRTLASYGIPAGRVAGLTGVWTEYCRLDDLAQRANHGLEDQAGRGAPNLQATTYNPQSKIAAVGVKLSASGVTSHGFALNVAPDLRGFAQIIPCGISDRGVTSMEQLLGTAPPLDEVMERVLAAFAEVFDTVLWYDEDRDAC